jgi:radical SAM superfamily enzyme YgiQ (UPF0313 family)
LSKLISFVQPNFQQGPKEANSYYLPYSIGMVWSYAQTSEYVKNSYTLDRIIFKREPVEETARQLATNSVVGFSTYVWNKTYNYELARLIKLHNPNCITIFGGPELPISDINIFKRLPFIDIVVKKEGELVLKDILENIDTLETIPGLIINRRGSSFDTGVAERIIDLDQLPSPYANGFFDQLVMDHPEIEWAATLETNRGCPYQCTFCDWGSLIYSKIKQFNLERVYGDIEWICKKRCGFIFIADANFGIFPERDNLIIDYLLEKQKQYGFPYTFTVSWAKNQKQEVVGMAAKLADAKMYNNGLTISVQSMDEKVLDNIKRKNLNQHKIEDIFEMCAKKQVPVTTEVILGLPGETLESWKQNIWTLFEAGNHSGVDITQVELLENAEMTQVQKQIYNMKTTTVYDYLGTNIDSLYEGIEVVTSTRDLPFEDMISAQAFNTYINTFHIGGLTAIISRFLRKYKDISYKEFYTKLYECLYQDEWFRDEEDQVRYYFKKWMTDGSINHENLGNIEIHGYNLIYRTLMRLHLENRLDSLYEKINCFLEQFNLDNDIQSQLIKFQRNFIITYNDISKFPLTEKYTIDIWNYLLGGNIDNQVTYKFEYINEHNISSLKFLELLYYGRRRNFAKAHITLC